MRRPRRAPSKKKPSRPPVPPRDPRELAQLLRRRMRDARVREPRG